MIDNWQQVLISPSFSIEEAIQVIDQTSVRAVIVVDDDHKLLGMLTDGDIRRGLLKKVKLTEPVATIMNATPVTAPERASSEEIMAILEECQLLQIPLVNDQQQVVGVETLEHIAWPQKRDNIVFLMVGGFGKRLRPLTENTPKPLLKVGGCPVLQNIVENFIKAGFHRFVFAVHYKSHMIEDYFGDGHQWGVQIDYVYEEKPLGTAGALGALPAIDAPLILMNGDLLTKVDFPAMLRFHSENKALATVGVREYDFQLPYGLIKSEEARVTEIVEKPVYNFFVNAGLYVLSPEAVALAEPNQPLDMPDLLKQLIANDGMVSMFPIHEYWLDIGRVDDFEQAQKEFSKFF